MDEGLNGDPGTAYRASKKLAEEAAWQFVEKERPNFVLSVLCPPLVLGPVQHAFNSLDNLNTSNENVRDMIMGKWKSGLQPTRVVLFVDVRDLALAHVRAVERPAAANKRFFVVSGFFRNSEVADIIKKNFPDLASKLPDKYEADPKDFRKQLSRKLRSA